MNTLLLIRHAKSSWDVSSPDDLMRPLNPRGYRNIGEMAQRDLLQRYTPDSILCSPAIRAYSTALGLMRELDLNASRLRLCEWIYDALPLRLKEGLLQNADLQGTVWLVGHNPGIEELVSMLAGEHVMMPTLAVAVIADPLGDRPRLLEWTSPKSGEF